MFREGNHVKINLYILDETTMCNTTFQKEAWEYIQDHPDEIYLVESVDRSGGFSTMGSVHLAHPILGQTTFFEDELILVKR